MYGRKGNDSFVAGFIGMALIGACGVSLGFPPMAGGIIGFIIGVILSNSK